MPTLNLPVLHGNWLDLLIILILFWFFWEGLGKGFITGTLDLLGFAVSFIAGLKSYWLISLLLVGNFSLPKGIADAVGFILAGIIGEAIFSFLVNLFIKKLPKNHFLFRVHKVFGVVPSVLNGLILTAFFLTITLALPVNPGLKTVIISSKIGSQLVLKTQNLENQLNKIFGPAIADTLNFLTIKQDSENINLNFTTDNYTLDEASEERMLVLINKERQKENLPALVFDTQLKAVARNHARDMLKRGYFSHNTPEGMTPFNRMNDAGIAYLTAGENLAFAPNVEIAHVGLMNSPGHRANILHNNYGKVGIGVLDAGIYGKIFVQEFTN